MSDNPYGRAADLYYGKGWRGILPLPHRRKKLPPTGFTGSAGTDPAYPDIAAWADGTEGPKNICLRLPENVIGIDVDARNRDLLAPRTAEVKRNLFGTKPEMPGQIDLFGAAS